MLSSLVSSIARGISAGTLMVGLVLASTAAGAQPRWSPLLVYPEASETYLEATSASLLVNGEAVVGIRMGSGAAAWPAVRERRSLATGFRRLRRIGPKEQLQGGPDVRLNRRREAVAAWTSGERGLVAARRTAAGVWTKSRETGLRDLPDSFGGEATIGLSDTGVARAANLSCDTAGTCVAMAAQSAAGAGTWQPLGVLTVGPRAPGSGRPVLAMGEQGDAIVTWVRALDGRVVVADLRRDATAWTEPEAVSSAGSPVGSLVADVGPAGAAVVAWTGTVPSAAPADGVARGVSLATRAPGAGGFAVPERVVGPATPAYVSDVAIDAPGNVAVAWNALDGEGGGTLEVTSRRVGQDGFAPPYTARTSSGEESLPDGDLRLAAARVFLFWDHHHGPGDNSVGAFVGSAGSSAYRRADYYSATGYPEALFAVAANGTGLAARTGLTIQNFDQRRWAGRPRAARLRLLSRSRRPVVRFTLNKRARVQAFALRAATGRAAGRTRPRLLSAGIRTIRLARVPRGNHRIVVRACTAARGCVDRVTPLTRIR